MSRRQPSLGALKAAEVVATLGIREASHLVVEAMAWVYHLKVKSVPFDGADGCLVRHPAGGTILVRGGLDPGRYRFTVAHELGHFLLHHQLRLRPCAASDLTPWSTRHEFERDADEFAAHLLLPEEIVASRMRSTEPSLTAVDTIARELQTSLTATALRYVELSGFPCALVVSSADGIEWFQVSEDFPGWFTKGQSIHANSFAYDALQAKDVPTRMETILATAWFKERRWKDVLIREQAIRLGSYGRALSLIWVPG
jgi:hypothetical protein